MLTISLLGYFGFPNEPVAVAENTAPKSEVEQGAPEQAPGQPSGPATIDGFRQALFGLVVTDLPKVPI